MKTLKSKSIHLVVYLIMLMNFSLVEAKIIKHSARNISNDNLGAVLTKYKINPDHVSLQILEDNNEVYSLNAESKKNPASISKLLTTFAVLKKFSVGHKFHTKVYSDGINLYLQGGGDPGFVSENLWYLVNEFRRSGIKLIKGNIIVDDSLFDRIRFDDSRQDKRVDRAYDSPVGAMSFNWNAVNIFIRSGKSGEKARITVDPENDYYQLVNNTMTVAGSVKRELIVNISNSEKIITVSGDVSVKSKEKTVYKGIDEPEIWSGTNLLSFLNQRGITVEGRVVSGSVPEGAELVLAIESKSVSSILSDMNKFSNNYVSEMLVKNMAALEQKSGATLKRGVEMIREELAKIGISRDEVTLISPSGLSNENSFSAAALNKVLTHVKKDFSIYPIILEGLPVAGVDGTLKNRMKGTLAEGWVRAKTGTLNGVVTLAGYAGRRNGKVLTFSFLYNGPQDESSVREAFDNLIINSLK